MSQENIIRAWKDRNFRDSLSEGERASLPNNPAGLIELTDEQLAPANGGRYCISCYDCTKALDC